MKPEKWSAIQEAFEAALALPPEARAAYLQNLQDHDAELVAEVASLLEMDNEGPDPIAAAIGEAAGAVQSESAYGPGSKLGAYRLLEAIGHGGMGAVYRAERSDDAFKKTVAVKVMRTLATGSGLRRFREERQILATLEHPHIARLLDGGATEEQVPYLVMEFVQGDPIDAYCRSRALGLAERLRLFCAVCDAVAYAHRTLVVHRDIKPSNILVTAEGMPKLLDFGIAKLLDPNRDTATYLTTEGLFPFTPAYASPEQVRGHGVTTSTDVYSLGLLLYELLVDERPQEGADASPQELVQRVCDTEPTLPSVRTASIDSSLPQPQMARRRERLRWSRLLRGDLDTIVMTALRKEPERRYPSVLGFADDVRRYLNGMPINARRDSVAYRTRKFVRRNVLGVVSAAVAVATLAVVAVGFAMQAQRVALERDRANLEAETAQQVVDFMVNLFEEASPVREGGRDRAPTAQMLLEAGAARVALEIDEPALRGRLLHAIGRSYSGLGLFADALPLFQASAEAARAGGPSSESALVAALRQVGRTYVQLRQLPQAEAPLREAFRRVRDDPDAGPEALGSAYASLGSWHHEMGELPEAEQYLRRALDWYATVLDADDDRLARTRHNVAQVLVDRGQHAPAIELLQQVLARDQRVWGDNHPDVAASYGALAIVLADQGDLVGAIEMQERGLTLRRRLLGDHAYVATDMHNLATMMRDQGDLEGATRLLKQVVESRVRLLGENHLHTATSQVVLAEIKLRQGQAEAAAPAFRAALAVLDSQLGEEHWKRALVRREYGTCLWQLGRLDEAEAHLMGAHEALTKNFAPDDPRVVKTAARLQAFYNRDGGNR